MHWRITALWRGKKVGLRETEPGGDAVQSLAVFFEFLLRIGYRASICRSPKAIDTVKTFSSYSRW